METTQPIAITVKTAYLDDQSQPEFNRFVFAYTITIVNTGDIATQLLRRHWIITDANNVQQEVLGDGVVGEKPRIAPGDHYTYTSGVVLETEVGTMEGHYQMQTDDGWKFDAPIPTFALAHPKSLH
jgi:ApaG protein